MHRGKTVDNNRTFSARLRMFKLDSASSLKKRIWFLVPLGIFLILSIYFAVGLTKDPSKLPSVLINQQVPPFDLKPIKGYSRGFSSADLLGKVSLVNIFGSWCVSCIIEHPFLMQLQQRKEIPIYGIDWREKTEDAGPLWLIEKGDPYTLIGNDPESKAAIAFGVTGAPETFIVDKKGIIRYKYAGPLGPEVWSKIFMPIITELRKQ